MGGFPHHPLFVLRAPWRSNPSSSRRTKDELRHPGAGSRESEKMSRSYRGRYDRSRANSWFPFDRGCRRQCAQHGRSNNQDRFPRAVVHGCSRKWPDWVDRRPSAVDQSATKSAAASPSFPICATKPGPRPLSSPSNNVSNNNTSMLQRAPLPTEVTPPCPKSAQPAQPQSRPSS